MLKSNLKRTTNHIFINRVHFVNKIKELKRKWNEFNQNKYVELLDKSRRKKRLRQKNRWRKNRKSDKKWKKFRNLGLFRKGQVYVLKVKKTYNTSRTNNLYLSWKYSVKLRYVSGRIFNYRKKIKYEPNRLFRKRLDSWLIIKKICRNLFMSRKLIEEGLIRVNGKISNNYNIALNRRDIISVKIKTNKWKTLTV